MGFFKNLFLHKGDDMNNRQYIAILVIAIIGGFIGGVISNKVFVDRKAFAQDKSARTIITANEFRTADEEGNILAKLVAGSTGASLRFLKRSNPLVEKKTKNQNIKAGYQQTYEAVTKGGPSCVVYLDDSGLTFKGEDYRSSVSHYGFSLYKGPQSFFFDVPLICVGLDLSKFSGDPQGENPLIRFSDKNKKSRLTIGIADSGEPRIALTDNIWNSRAILGYTELTLKKTKSTEIRHASSLVLFDEDGNVIWSAP